MGWKSYVQRFLSKRNIKSRKTHGEAADADTAAAESFFSELWPEIFDGVDRDPSRVWNMDETGLFWRDDVVEIVNSLEPSPGGREECGQDEEVPEELPEPPSSAALLQALDTVRSALYACKADAALHSHLTKIETHLAAQAAARSRQSTLMELWN